MHEQSYLAGQRSSANRLLRMALGELGYKGTEAEHAKWITEREEAIAALRGMCEDYGDNDWDERLHLADVIEKHLRRHMDSEVEPEVGLPMNMRYFKTEEMLNALSLSVVSDGPLWTIKDGHRCQKLSWSAEEAIAFVVGRMLEPDVRQNIIRDAVVLEVEPDERE
jgi:hypothetical protein